MSVSEWLSLVVRKGPVRKYALRSEIGENVTAAPAPPNEVADLRVVLTHKSFRMFDYLRVTCPEHISSPFSVCLVFQRWVWSVLEDSSCIAERSIKCVSLFKARCYAV